MVKAFIPILLISLGILSDLYIFHRYINFQSMWRWIWWFPAIGILCFALYFVFFGKGFGVEYNSINIFLLLIGICCIPKIIFAIFAPLPKVGTWLGIIAALGIIYIILYGITLGFSKFHFKYVTYESSTVPKAFDGYRIVQFSDTHTGTFRGPYHKLLRESIDSINTLKPDLICFVGDIVNFSPEELMPHIEAYSSLRATDGVVTIMGNHDYASYINISPKERLALVNRTRELQHTFGWDMLSNTHRIIYRSNTDEKGNVHCDSIVLIGEENWGKPPFPQYGNIEQALKGLTIQNRKIITNNGQQAFSIMLSHDPNAWREHIMPIFKPEITMSGHTHGTQFSIFGWSTASMLYKEWGGIFYEKPSDSEQSTQQSILSVTTGMGGNFPFRFGMPREAVVITLKHKE